MNNTNPQKYLVWWPSMAIQEYDSWEIYSHYGVRGAAEKFSEEYDSDSCRLTESGETEGRAVGLIVQAVGQAERWRIDVGVGSALKYCAGTPRKM